jgi:hypothetical protein
MRLLPILLLIFSCLAYGQELNNPNKLKPCPQDQNARYHICWGPYTFANGDKYVGEYKDDKRNGMGTYTFANGDKHEGRFEDNEMIGWGIRTESNGSLRREGYWENGKFAREVNYSLTQQPSLNKDETFRVENYSKEIFFRGVFKGGKRSKGHLEKINPNDLPICQGRVHYNRWDNCWGSLSLDGHGGDIVQIGEWKNGSLNGLGIQRNLVSEEEYVGEFRNGKFDGYGVLTRIPFLRRTPAVDGENSRVSYFGFWREGRHHGKGMLIENFSEFWGDFQNGSFTGIGREVSSLTAEISYEGEFENFKQSGFGIRYKTSTAIGFFLDGQLNGLGIVFNAQGQKEKQGEWKVIEGKFLGAPQRQEKLLHSFEIDLTTLLKRLKIPSYENPNYFLQTINKVDGIRTRCLSEKVISVCVSSPIKHPDKFLCNDDGSIFTLENRINPNCYFRDRSQLLFDLELKNNSNNTVFDVEISCEQIGKSKTVLSKTNKILYDRWVKNEIKKIEGIVLLRSDQADSIKCVALNWSKKP